MNLSWLRASIVLVVIILLTSACSLRRTRQFVAGEASEAEWLPVGEWLIDSPKLVAFRDVIDLTEIVDTNLFWVTIIARHLRPKEAKLLRQIEIDSVQITFLPDGPSFWRKPTRVATFDAPRGRKFVYRAFDFFGDQGITIPMTVARIKLDFDVVFLDSDSTRDSHPVVFHLERNETAFGVPLLQQ